jgi:hypothetical protein
MSYQIVFDNDGSWSGKGKFPVNLKDMSNISKWVVRFLHEFHEVGDKYSEYISNDGILVGQEKVNLVKELDDVIGGMILFRSYIVNDNKGVLYSMENKYNSEFVFNYDSLGWDGYGKLLNKYVFNIKNFKDWYNAMMFKLKEVFTKYLNSIRDEVLSAEEIKNIIILLEIIIFDIIIIEKKLVTSDINK